MRCTRCGHDAGDQDKFCAECGVFLRDAHIDSRLLLALATEGEGREREARRSTTSARATSRCLPRVTLR